MESSRRDLLNDMAEHMPILNFEYFSRSTYVEPHQWKALAETF